MGVAPDASFFRTIQSKGITVIPIGVGSDHAGRPTYVVTELATMVNNDYSKILEATGFDKLE